ncbi:mediator of RNA polymerase II transcription subunit 25 [Tanacetum coccineum]
MADTKKKKLVLVVEGTAALAPHWPTILEDYLSKLIRSFYGDEAIEAATPYVELALVVFNAPGSYSRAYISSPDFSYPDMSQYLLFSSVLCVLHAAFLVHRSGWTRSVDYFLELLSAMNFSDGGFCEAAIAEGLNEVLMSAKKLYPNGIRKA